MHHVDTLDLCINFRRYREYVDVETGEIKRKIDFNYVGPIDEKIRNRLYLDRINQEKSQKEGKVNQLSRAAKIALYKIVPKRKQRIIYYQGEFNGYRFIYNSKWNALKIHLSHNKVEQYTADEIISNVKEAVITYFKLDAEDVKDITLLRIDVKNDFRCRNQEQIDIVKNIISKATCKFRNYKKEIKQDDSKGYTVNYINRKLEMEKKGKESVNNEGKSK